MRTLLQTIFGRRQPGHRRNDCGPELRVLRNGIRTRRLSGEKLWDSEQLEPRLALAVGVLEYGVSFDAINNAIRYPGRVYVASNNASDVFIQRVTSSPEDLLVADNGSFLDNRVINAIQDYDSMLVTNGVARSETVEATQWWLFPGNVTKLALEQDDVPTRSPFRLAVGTGSLLREPRDISGTIEYEQADGVVSTWTFTAWDGSRVPNNPSQLVISSGPGYASRETSFADRRILPRQELRTGYIYPEAVYLRFDGVGSHLEIQWSATPVRPPVTRANYLLSEEGNLNSTITRSTSAVGTAANPSLTFELPGARTSVYDGGSQQVSLGVIPGTLTGSFRIGSLGAGLSDRVAVNGSTSLVIGGTQANVLDRRIFFDSTGSNTESYFIGTGDVGVHSFSLNVSRDESDNDFFFPDGPGDTHRDLPFVGWTVNTAAGQSVTAGVQYLVFARDPQPNTVTFAAGLDIANEVTVDLLTAGSTLNVNSPIAVSVTDGDIDLRATNININAPVSTPDRMYIGRSQTHVNQPRLLRPLEEFRGAGDYDDGLLDTPTFNPLRSPGNVAKQVRAQAEVSPDGRIRRLVVLPGDEGYGYDADNPPEVYVGVPTPQRAAAEVISLSGGVQRVVLEDGGTGYANGAVATATAPEFGFIESVTITGAAERYLINGNVPDVPPLVIIEEPDLLRNPDRIGHGRRARANATVQSDGRISVAVTDGGLNYQRAPTVRVATFLEATVESVATSNGQSVLTLGSDFRDSEFLSPGMPVVINDVSSGLRISGTDGRQITTDGLAGVGSGDTVRFYLNDQYLQGDGQVIPAGIGIGNLGYDVAEFTVSTANGVIVGIFVLNEGSGYQSAPEIIITPVTATAPGGGGAQTSAGSGAVASVVFAGGIAEAVINLRGTNYQPGPLGPIAVQGTGGSGATVLFEVDEAGIVSGGAVTAPGQGYLGVETMNQIPMPAPRPFSADQLESRAAFRAVVQPDGSVRGFELIQAGDNYSAPPAVSVAAPLRPTSATATTRIDAASGQVTEVRLQNQGLLYAWTPKVSIAPPPAGSGGVRARAQAFLNEIGQIDRVEIVDRGSGYESRPDVWIEPQALFTVVETLQVGADLNAEIYEIYIGDEVATPNVPKGLFNLSPEATLGGQPLSLAVQPSSGSGEENFLVLNLDATTTITAAAIAGMTISGNGIAPGTVVTGYSATDKKVFLSSSLSGSTPSSVRIDQRGTAMFFEAAAADISLGGRLDVATQSYLLASGISQQAAGPFNFQTQAAGAKINTGRISGGTVAVVLGNDLISPQQGGIIENTVDLDLQVGSLRMTAAESELDPRGPFPYRIALREEDNIDIDAVVATSGDLSLVAGGSISLNTAIDTDGSITLRSDTLEVTSRLATRFGKIDIESGDLRIANSLAVTAAAPDRTATDISLRASGGNVFLQGDVTAVNKIFISQQHPADSPGKVYGPATISGRELLLQAEGDVEISTAVETIRGFAGQVVSIVESDDVTIPSFRVAEAGVIELRANGSDKGAFGVNPIALTAKIYDANEVVVSAPSGSIDVTTESVGDVQIGNLADIRTGTGETMVAGGGVTIRSRAGDVIVYDAPVATSGARRVAYATIAPLVGSTYVVSTDGFSAAYLTGADSLNDLRVDFFGEDIDGSFRVGDRVLVKDQVDDPLTTNIDESRENGVYVVTRVGGGVAGYRDWRLTRAEDSLRSADLSSGSYVVVENEGEKDNVFWVSYVDDIDVAVEQTDTNQLILPESFGQIGGLQLNQPVVGGGIGTGAVVTSVDYENRVVTLGLRNRFQAEVGSEAGVSTLKFAEPKPLLIEAIEAALANGETVVVSGSGLQIGSKITKIIDADSGLLELSVGSVSAVNRITDVTVGFSSAASGRRVLNPAVRSFLLEGEVLASNSDSFRVSQQFANFDSLYVGQPIFGDGVLPNTRIGRLNPAEREVSVTPGGLPVQLPGPSRFESDSRSQRFRLAHEAEAAEFIAIDTFTFFNFDLFTDSRIEGEEIEIQSDLFIGGAATLRDYDEERGLVYVDSGSLIDPERGEDGSFVNIVVSGIAGGEQVYQAAVVNSGVVRNFDYLVYAEDSLRVVPGPSTLVSGNGIATGARVLRTIVDNGTGPGGEYGFGPGARIVILAPNSLFTPTDIRIVNFLGDDGVRRQALEPEEIGRFQGNFSGDLIRLSANFTGINVIEIGDPVTGPGIRPDTIIEGIDLELGLVAVSLGGVNSPDDVPFVEFNRSGRIYVADVLGASARSVNGATLVGDFDGDRIYLQRDADEFAQLQLNAAVQGPGIASNATITGFDARTGLIGLSAGSLEDPEGYRDGAGGRITLQVNLPVTLSSETPSIYYSEGFEKYIEMQPDFSDYDLIHVGQKVQGFDQFGQVVFNRFVTAVDPFRRFVGLSAEPLVPGSGPVVSVLFRAAENISFGLTSGLGTTGVTFVGNSFGKSAIDITNPVRLTALGRLSSASGQLQDEVIELISFDGWAELEQLYREAEGLGVGLRVTGTGVVQGTMIASLNIGDASVTLSKPLASEFLAGGGGRAELRLNFHGLRSTVETVIGSDQQSAVINFVIASNVGTNSGAGGLGKMISLYQGNNLEGSRNPDQVQSLQFWDGLRGPIELRQELPEIASGIVIDGNSRYTAPNSSPVANPAPIVVTGATILEDRLGNQLGSEDEYNGFQFVSGANSAVIRNVTLGGFFNGSAVHVDNAGFLLLDGLRLGVDEEGQRDVNARGVTVTGDAAKFVTIANSRITGSTSAGVVVENGARDVRFVGNQFGTVEVPNEIGIRLRSADNSVGALPVFSGTDTLSGAAISRSQKSGAYSVITATGLMVDDIRPGMGVFLESADRVTLLRGESLGDAPNVAEITGVDTASNAVVVNGEQLVLGSGVSLSVRHLVKGAFNTDVLEIPETIAIKDLFVGQGVSGAADGVPVGTFITEIVPAEGGRPAYIRLSNLLSNNGFNRTSYRRVRFESIGGGALRNLFVNNRYGVDVGLSAISSGAVGSDRIQISSDFDSWDGLSVGMQVRGDGIPPETRIAEVSELTRSVTLDKEATTSFTRQVISFQGADRNRIVNSTFERNLYSGVLVTGGEEHEIGRAVAVVPLAERSTVSDGDDWLELVSYSAAGAVVEADLRTLQMPRNYVVRADDLVAGMRVYGKGIPAGAEIASILTENIAAAGEPEMLRIVKVTLDQEGAFLPGTSLTVRFGLNRFLSVETAAALSVGLGVSGDGIVDYTKVEDILSPDFGSGYVELTTPDSRLSDNYLNSKFQLSDTDQLVFTKDDSSANQFINNDRFGIEAVAAAFRNWTTSVEAGDSLARSWVIAGNLLGVTRANAFAGNGLGDMSVALEDLLGGGALLARGFDRVDSYGNQYGAALPVSDRDDPASVDDPDADLDPPGGPGEPNEGIDDSRSIGDRIPVIRF